MPIRRGRDAKRIRLVNGRLQGGKKGTVTQSSVGGGKDTRTTGVSGVEGAIGWKKEKTYLKVSDLEGSWDVESSERFSSGGGPIPGSSLRKRETWDLRRSKSTWFQ